MSRMISQVSFARGLQTLVQPFAQGGKGLVSRISNLYFTVRGALKTVDGASQVQLYTKLAGGVLTGPIHAMFLSKTSYGVFAHAALHEDNIATPGVPTVIPTAGGSLPAGTYSYKIAARDAAGRETLVGSAGEGTTGGVNVKMAVSWAAVEGTFTYAIYGRTSGSWLFIAATSNLSYEDLGTITPAGNPVVTNTTQALALRAPSGVIRKYPVTGIVKNVLLPGACGSGSTTANSSGDLLNATPNGGISAVASVLPQVVPFQSKALVGIGNGIVPEVYDPATGTRTALTNTFTTSYPVWLAASAYKAGDYITPTVLNGSRYVCTQGGTSGGVQPTFPTTVDVTVRDGQVIWKNAGTDTSTVPPGAAHTAVHGGALWVFNTRFSNSADGLDGPSSLRMSDVGNMLSWNPLNQIFIGKEDQQEGMGLATFSIGEQGIVPTGQLVAFKQFSTYSVLGLMGSPNFAVNRVKTDMGCIAPRTIEFVSGRGIIRLTHRGVAVFDGINDYVISDPVRPYLFDDDGLDIRGMDMDYAYFSKASQAADPLLYVLAIPVITDQTDATRGNLKRLLIFDVFLKLWTVVDLPFPIASLFQAIVPGSIPLTLCGAYSDARVRRLFCGDDDWGTFGPITWSFRPQEIFSNSATRRVYVRQLLLRCLGAGVPTSAAFRINESTTEDPNSAYPPLTEPMRNSAARDGTRFESIAPLHRTVLNVTADISGTGQIEIDAVEWEVTDKHAAVPLQMV